MKFDIKSLRETTERELGISGGLADYLILLALSKSSTSSSEDVYYACLLYNTLRTKSGEHNTSESDIIRYTEFVQNLIVKETND